MPPFVIPTLVKIAFGAAGAAAIVHWAVKEARRLREEFERTKTAKVESIRREALPTLRRDPVSGEWRIRNR
jgi:hypothetical protein